MKQIYMMLIVLFLFSCNQETQEINISLGINRSNLDISYDYYRIISIGKDNKGDDFRNKAICEKKGNKEKATIYLDFKKSEEYIITLELFKDRCKKDNRVNIFEGTVKEGEKEVELLPTDKFFISKKKLKAGKAFFTIFQQIKQQSFTAFERFGIIGGIDSITTIKGRPKFSISNLNSLLRIIFDDSEDSDEVNTNFQRFLINILIYDTETYLFGGYTSSNVDFTIINPKDDSKIYQLTTYMEPIVLNSSSNNKYFNFLKYLANTQKKQFISKKNEKMKISQTITILPSYKNYECDMNSKFIEDFNTDKDTNFGNICKEITPKENINFSTYTKYKNYEIFIGGADENCESPGKCSLTISDNVTFYIDEKKSFITNEKNDFKLKIPRYGHNVVVYKDIIWVIGGVTRFKNLTLEEQNDIDPNHDKYEQNDEVVTKSIEILKLPKSEN